ncbi:MAG TPA: sigma-70 family RNA polymerase sigma factor [Thermomicrobiales bacterium]|nr:sigma-70 family RNA polymerase sigma factor [Thermomicrobiales bacterium]
MDQQQYDRLVRFCWSLTHSAGAAEDLASETLLEGCRNAHKVTDADGLDPWLRAIARNVCLRWRRQQGRDTRVVSFSEQHDRLDDRDLECASDREGLDADLTGALASLPPTTRTAFLMRHLEDASHSEIAARTGLSEAAVSMRLSRARTQLRRTLESERAADDAGRAPERFLPGWRDTRLWCSRCGVRRQQIRHDDASGIVSFRCPDCDDSPQVTATEMPLANAHIERMIGGLRQPAAINRRIEAWVNDYFRRALSTPDIACTHCGAPATVIRSMPSVSATVRRSQLGLHVRCDRCGTACSSSLHSLVMAVPEVSAFCRANGRVRTLPMFELEASGQPAVRTTIESVTTAARLDVVSARDTLAVLGVHRSSQAPAS